ncbi:hypothetical protein AMTRI_Chr09g34100 [Amborella trichopoda]
MEGRRSAMEAASRRPVLSDIGNFVGGHPLRYAAYKQGVEGKMIPIGKNPAIAANRPMTRRFAASLTNKQTWVQVQKQKIEPVENVTWGIKHQRTAPFSSSSNDSKDFVTIDVEECAVKEVIGVEECKVKEVIMPAVIEAMAEDPAQHCDMFDEVEMEDVSDPIIPDIDSCDSNNPLAVADYVDDIYQFYMETENSSCVPPNYMSNQTDINDKMRAILIDWLIEVHYKFELMDETLFLTVNLLDRFLACQTVLRKRLQLVGVTALLLACKYEEVSVPVVEDLILISDRAYSRAEVLQMEKLMVNTLQFQISLPTPYVFMRRFLKAAEADKKLEFLSFFLIELCLVQYEMLKYCPSFLVAAAIYTAQCTIKGYRFWSPTSEYYTTYSEDQLLECSRSMVDFHQKAATGKLTGVHRKFNTFKFGFASKYKPALFLLEAAL